MAANSNMSFHHDTVLSSALNRHAISYQSGATNSVSGMVSTGNAYNSSVMTFSDNSGIINTSNGITSLGNSSGGFLLDSAPDLKNDNGVAADWSTDEQSKLEQGLVKFGDEPTIMRYIKIAAKLRDKTVRDVALRCQWMTSERIGKRRKPEDHNRRKMKDRKEFLMESSKANIPRAPTVNISACSPVIQHIDHNNRISSEGLGSSTRRLLDDNAEVFNQIMTNLSTYRIQENIDLLCRTRDNISVILNNMRDMPGIMSQMPPLPVSVNQNLANSILPSTAQGTIFSLPSSIHMKQERGC